MIDAGNYGIEDGWPYDPADVADDPVDAAFARRVRILQVEADRHPDDEYGDSCRAKLARMSS